METFFPLVSGLTLTSEIVLGECCNAHYESPPPPPPLYLTSVYICLLYLYVCRFAEKASPYHFGIFPHVNACQLLGLTLLSKMFYLMKIRWGLANLHIILWLEILDVSRTQCFYFSYLILVWYLLKHRFCWFLEI